MGYYPERLHVAVPKGWRAKVEKLASEKNKSPADWLRGLLRNAFEADRKRRARRDRK